MLAISVMSVGYALGAIYMKRGGKSVDIRWNIAFQCAAASVVLLTASVFVEPGEWRSTAWKDPSVVASLLYLAVVSTAIGWMIYFRLIRVWGVLRASATTYLMPFVALFLDWIWLGYLPTSAQLFGGGMIVLSVALLHSRKPRLVEA
jgi:drug/metabolite transporter (DMT)-like permease